MLKRTPLNSTHKELKARMVDFGGWDMPVQYRGIIEEHQAVRNKAGLFDVSHMGEISIRGKNAELFLQYLMTNDVAQLSSGGILYTLMCHEDGGIVDDLLVHKYEKDHYMLCVNASNTQKDFEWMLENQFKSTEILNVSPTISQLAIQGPDSEKILQRIIDDADLSKLKYYRFVTGKFSRLEIMVARTGYTGEDGFEIYFDSGIAESVFRKILEAGEKDGIMPIGLGARDTLRLEMGFSLYGHEIDENHNPYEANLGRFVKLDKEEFIGQEALLKIKENGIKRKLVAFEVTERGIPRAGYEIFAEGKKTGEVASGTFSPTLKKSIGTGYVAIKHAGIDEGIEIDIRRKKVKAKIVKPPFYKRKK